MEDKRIWFEEVQRGILEVKLFIGTQEPIFQIANLKWSGKEIARHI